MTNGNPETNLESPISSPVLVYHQATLDLLGQEYASRPSHRADAFARFHELHLPASVLEWYSIPFAVDVLSRYSNADEALEPATFMLHNDENMEILEFLIENQGCWTCGILLDGSEDPPVVINPDPSATRPVWNYGAERFSVFVYTRVFDYQYLIRAWRDAPEEEAWYMDGPAPVGQLSNWLAHRFETEPAACDASHYVRRYSGQEKRQRLVIYENKSAAQWVLTGATAAQRRDLLAEVTARW